MTAALHERYPALRETLPHVVLGQRPTPLRRIADSSGTEVWVKDESTFGDGGWGGNKVRKLEWLIPDALRRGRRTILTFGGLGTNWGLVAALYGREHGLRTALALVDQPVDEHVRAQLARLESSGATLHFTHTNARTVAALPWLLARHAARGRLPYVLPAGGSSTIGTLGYVEAALELAAQVRAGAMPEPSHVITAVGTGGTAAGLIVGLRLAGLGTRVVGVVVNDKLPLDSARLLRRARRTERLLAARGADLPRLHITADDLFATREWLGPGYGHSTPEAQRALELAAGDGLALEPVYTAKAFAAVLAMAETRRLRDGPVVFLHTDGHR